jgi:hypothetical protein
VEDGEKYNYTLIKIKEAKEMEREEREKQENQQDFNYHIDLSVQLLDRPSPRDHESLN